MSMDTFLQRAIRARQITCELRNLLEELAGDAVIIEPPIIVRIDAEIGDITQELLPPPPAEYTADVFLCDMAHIVETVESYMDQAFPIDRFPSTDPITWRK